MFYSLSAREGRPGRCDRVRDETTRLEVVATELRWRIATREAKEKLGPRSGIRLRQGFEQGDGVELRAFGMNGQDGGRWLARPGSRELQVGIASLTPTETATMSALLAFMSAHPHDGEELMHCIDLAGTQLIDASGGYRESELTPPMRAVLDGDAGGRLWHNHPSGDSLSGGDWQLAGSGDIEVVAVTARGSVFAGRIPDWSDDMWLVIRSHGLIGGYADGAVRYLGGGDDPGGRKAALAGLVGHLINLDLARRELVAYAFGLSAEDTRALEKAQNYGLLQAAEAEVTSAIDDAIRRG